MPVWQSDGKNGRKPKRRYVSYHQQKLMSKLTTISLKIMGQKMTPMIFTLRGKYRADHSVFLVIFLYFDGSLEQMHPAPPGGHLSYRLESMEVCECGHEIVAVRRQDHHSHLY